MTDQGAASLRRALGGHVGGRGRRCAEALKARVQAFAEERRHEGRSWSRIAEELGLRTETVRRWSLESESGEVRMRPVELAPDSAGSGMVLVARSGHRVEGLTLEQVAELLRALG
jgi:hypothetical protein